MKRTLSLVFAFLISFGGSITSPAEAKGFIQVPNFFINLSNQTGVPADVLYALAVQESNTKMNNGTMAPWPWTINVGGHAYRYKTYDDMITAAYELLNQGRRSFDLSLFQVNYKWNGHRADSLEDLGEPYTNGLVAAEILLEHYARNPNWSYAAGRYHNPANKNGRADKYAAEFEHKLSLIQAGTYQRHLIASNG